MLYFVSIITTNGGYCKTNFYADLGDIGLHTVGFAPCKPEEGVERAPADIHFLRWLDRLFRATNRIIFSNN